MRGLRDFSLIARIIDSRDSFFVFSCLNSIFYLGIWFSSIILSLTDCLFEFLKIGSIVLRF